MVLIRSASLCPVGSWPAHPRLQELKAALFKFTEEGGASPREIKRLPQAGPLLPWAGQTGQVGWGITTPL